MAFVQLYHSIKGDRQLHLRRAALHLRCVALLHVVLKQQQGVFCAH